MSFGDKKGLKLIQYAIPHLKTENLYGILGKIENAPYEKNSDIIKEMINKELDKRDKQNGKKY